MIRHNSALTNALEGLNAGLQTGLQVARYKKDVEEGKQRYELAKQSSERADALTESSILSNIEERKALVEDQQFQRENQEYIRRARGVEEEGQKAIQQGQALLMKIHGNPAMSEEELGSLLEQVRGIGAETKDPKARQWFYEQSGDFAKTQAIDASLKDVVEDIKRLSTPTADAEGNQVPGLLDEKRAEVMSERLIEHRKTRGASGLSPDKAREMLWGLLSEQTNKDVQAAAWTQSSQKMAEGLVGLSNPMFGLPPVNMRKAMFVLSLANKKPPMTAEQQAVVEKAFIEALFHSPTEAEMKRQGAPERSVAERAREMAFEEVELGLFTNKDDKGHANVDTVAVRAREAELMQSLSRERSDVGNPMAPFRYRGQGGSNSAAASPAGQSIPAAAPATSTAPAAPSRDGDAVRSDSQRAGAVSRPKLLDTKQTGVQEVLEAARSGATAEELEALLKKHKLSLDDRVFDSDVDPMKGSVMNKKEKDKKPARRGAERVGPNF